jgi:DNA helicase-2/ATP-dependent DNA helicase PcrA
MATGDAEQIEEERRLLYVALTRARDRLTVHFPLRYHVGSRPRSDRHSYAQVSRFLAPSVRECFEEHTTYEEDCSTLGPAAFELRRSVGVDDFLTDLWSG